MNTSIEMLHKYVNSKLPGINNTLGNICPRAIPKQGLGAKSGVRKLAFKKKLFF
jgi:hypothetical protein